MAATDIELKNVSPRLAAKVKPYKMDIRQSSTVIPILEERPACRYDWCGEKVLDIKVG